MAKFYDSHCHLNDEQYDLAEELALCRENSVAACMIVGTSIADSRRALEICDQWQNNGVALGASCGVHPEEVTKVGGEWVGELEDLLTHPHALALGEIGLDYHWEPETAEEQKVLLQIQLDLARKKNKAVIFHLRDCHADFWEFMEGQPPLKRAVMHCFDGTLEDALRGVALGWYVGFTGALTFKKNDELRRIASVLPPDRVLTETDCPYMAPVPYRGKTNHPGWVGLVCATLAECQNLSVEAMAEQVAENGRALFGLEVK